MLKYVFYVVIAAVLAGLIAGGVHLFKVSQKNKKEMARYSQKTEYNGKLPGRILVVYYSLSGHTREIAEKIRGMTGAELYEIKTARVIKNNPLIYWDIKKQLKNKTYPELYGEKPDIDNYDVIFVGAPVWWYTVATPALSFLQQVDFKGKKVVPFSTQGSNYGTFFEDFAKAAKNANLQPSASFNNLPDEYRAAVENKIAVWLNSLN